MGRSSGMGGREKFSACRIKEEARGGETAWAASADPRWEGPTVLQAEVLKELGEQKSRQKDVTAASRNYGISGLLQWRRQELSKSMKLKFPSLAALTCYLIGVWTRWFLSCSKKTPRAQTRFRKAFPTETCAGLEASRSGSHTRRPKV